MQGNEPRASNMFRSQLTSPAISNQSSSIFTFPSPQPLNTTNQNPIISSPQSTLDQFNQSPVNSQHSLLISPSLQQQQHASLSGGQMVNRSPLSVHNPSVSQLQNKQVAAAPLNHSQQRNRQQASPAGFMQSPITNNPQLGYMLPMSATSQSQVALQQSGGQTFIGSPQPLSSVAITQRTIQNLSPQLNLQLQHQQQQQHQQIHHHQQQQKQQQQHKQQQQQQQQQQQRQQQHHQLHSQMINSTNSPMISYGSTKTNMNASQMALQLPVNSPQPQIVLQQTLHAHTNSPVLSLTSSTVIAIQNTSTTGIARMVPTPPVAVATNSKVISPQMINTANLTNNLRLETCNIPSNSTEIDIDAQVFKF